MKIAFVSLKDNSDLVLNLFFMFYQKIGRIKMTSIVNFSNISILQKFKCDKKFKKID